MLCSIFSCRHIFLNVSKKDVWDTTVKDIVMPIFLPLLLIFVLLMCALWYHDVRFPPEGRAYMKQWKHDHERI
jgi:hypothetical protein